MQFLKETTLTTNANFIAFRILAQVKPGWITDNTPIVMKHSY